MRSITVLVVTYNQEDVISRCLDSILIQKDFGLKHIVVCDDCSSDNTWIVLQSYAQKYPHIIKPYRNEKNLGIYPNSEKTISLRGNADLFIQLAGDDALCDGWFKDVQLYIEKNGVDFNIPIGIYSDWKIVNDNGHESIFSQEIAIKGYNLFSLYLRAKIYNRSLLVNEKVVVRYEPLVLGKGLNLTEAVYDSQDHRAIEKAYYVPCVGSIYFVGVGISTQLVIGKSDYHTAQEITKWDFFLKKYITSPHDVYYAKFSIERAKFYISPSFCKLTKVLYYLFRSKLVGVDNYNDFIHVLFSMIRNVLKK